MAEYVTTPCATCGNPTTVLASQFKRGRGRSCSRSCGLQLALRAKWEKYYSRSNAIFWSRVDVRTETECWHWTGNRYSTTGYGRFKQLRRQVSTHRYALESKKGPPPEPGLFALHSCDNPICCNPSHLRWGTPQENSDDCVSRGRKRGAPSKIDLNKLLAMRASGLSTGAMAEHFSVHPSSIARATLRALSKQGDRT